jgi:hypothetical protein
MPKWKANPILSQNYTCPKCGEISVFHEYTGQEGTPQLELTCVNRWGGLINKPCPCVWRPLTNAIVSG